MKILPLGDDYDPYGKDVSPVSNGKMTVRIRDGKITMLSDKEVEANRAKRPRKKSKNKKRGNRWL